MTFSVRTLQIHPMKPGGALPRLALIAVICLALFVNLYHLNQVGRNGLGNSYYSAAVRSMLEEALASPE